MTRKCHPEAQPKDLADEKEILRSAQNDSFAVTLGTLVTLNFRHFPVMSFRFYTNMISQASRTVAASLSLLSLMLVGFGIVIAAFPEVFAYLAAAVFFVAGVGCAFTAFKIFWAQRKFDKTASDDSQPYRENVRIHIEEHRDF